MKSDSSKAIMSTGIIIEICWSAEDSPTGAAFHWTSGSPHIVLGSLCWRWLNCCLRHNRFWWQLSSMKWFGFRIVCVRIRRVVLESRLTGGDVDDSSYMPFRPL